MRGRTIIIGGILAAAILLPDAGRAQLSPQGILGGITRPFRHALGQVGHYTPAPAIIAARPRPEPLPSPE